jgi:hypothetical protein
VTLARKVACIDEFVIEATEYAGMTLGHRFVSSEKAHLDGGKN